MVAAFVSMVYSGYVDTPCIGVQSVCRRHRLNCANFSGSTHKPNQKRKYLLSSQEGYVVTANTPWCLCVFVSWHTRFPCRMHALRHYCTYPIWFSCTLCHRLEFSYCTVIFYCDVVREICNTETQATVSASIQQAAGAQPHVSTVDV